MTAKFPRLVLGFVVVVGLILHLSIIWPSGSRYCFGSQCGVFFWGSNEHDAVWHLALENTAFTTTPAQMPNFSGASLTGYNALMDQVIYGLNLVTKIPATIWYFKIIPLLWFGILTFLVIKLARKINDSDWYPPALLIFTYLGNSFSYFLTLIQHGSLSGASGLLSMQAPQTLTNIQFGLSLPILVGILILVKEKSRKLNHGLVLGFLVAIMWGLKFYGGAIASVIVAVYYLINFQRNGWKITIAGLASLVLFSLGSLELFYGLNSVRAGGATFTWSPLTTVHPIIEESDLVYLPKLANARYSLISHGIGLKLVYIEMITIGIFILMNFGARIIGIWQVGELVAKKKVSPFDTILMAGMFVGLFAATMFVQKGVWWNTVQFLYYSLFLANIYAAQVLSRLFAAKSLWGTVGAGIILILMLPNAIDTWRTFTSFPPRSYISDQEMELLNTLKQQPGGVVLALPINAIEVDKNAPLAPLYERYDTSYVAAYSAHPTYLNDQIQLELTGVGYKERKQAIERSDCQVLDQVKYVYIGGDQSQITPWKNCATNLQIIKQNIAGAVYRVGN